MALNSQAAAQLTSSSEELLLKKATLAVLLKGSSTMSLNSARSAKALMASTLTVF